MKYFIATFLILTVGCVSNHQSEREQALSHVVLCWLKEPGNADHRNQIIEVSKTFKKIPGVLDVRVGKVIESN